MGVYSVQFTAKYGKLQDDDFQGPTQEIYRRLHARLRQREAHERIVHQTTISNLIPVFIIIGIIFIMALGTCATIVYIARFA